MTIADQAWVKVVSQYKCVHWPLNHKPCVAPAVGILLGPDSGAAPGCFYCAEHARATLIEYKAKLGEIWSVRVGPCAGWTCIVTPSLDLETESWVIFDAPEHGGAALAIENDFAAACALARRTIETSAEQHGWRRPTTKE